jgi:nitronate monooxygenase
MAGLDRAKAFCNQFGMRLPVLQAPMAGSSPVDLAAAVADAGGMGARGALMDTANEVIQWVDRFRARSNGPLQLNVWVPEQPRTNTAEDLQRLADARTFLGGFGPFGEASAMSLPSFEEQCEALLLVRPAVVSSIMGLFEPTYVRRLHDSGIAWFACATTLDEAVAAQEAGADAIVAQSMEAGGHRGTFAQDDAERIEIGMLALIPWFADHLRVPIIAAGGIGDGRGLAAALTLGASAVQVGTALLRCPETGTPADWVARLDGLAPEATMTTRAYTGRLARAAATAYLQAWGEPIAPRPASFPDQLRLVTQSRRGSSDVDALNHWAGQGAALATDKPAGEVITKMWRDAAALIR